MSQEEFDLNENFVDPSDSGESGEVSQNQDNEIKEESSKKKRYKGVLKEVLVYLLIFFIGIYIIPTFVLQRTVVDGRSMENTLHNEESLLIDKISYSFHDPARFDIVVFYPYGKSRKEYYVKRVIGLPGETIQIKGEDIYINGKILKENYGKDPIDYAGTASEPLTLGDDEYFLMGDNREISFDSRYSDVGPVHRDLIEGKAFLRVWPLKKFGFIKK